MTRYERFYALLYRRIFSRNDYFSRSIQITMPWIEKTIQEEVRDCKNHPFSLWEKKSNGEYYHLCYKGKVQMDNTGSATCEAVDRIQAVTHKKWVEEGKNAS